MLPKCRKKRTAASQQTTRNETPSLGCSDRGLLPARWGRDGLWEYRSVDSVLGKGQQRATGTFQMLRNSEELPVKGYYKTITKSRSCLRKGWSKQAGLLAVSSLPGVPAARRGPGTGAEMRSCGMCIADLACASKGKGLAHYRFARTVAS